MAAATADDPVGQYVFGIPVRVRSREAVNESNDLTAVCTQTGLDVVRRRLKICLSFARMVPEHRVCVVHHGDSFVH